MGEQDVENNERKINSRIKAIDTFRGICLSLMIVVNDGGAGFQFLSHSPWNGITIADVLFPWFLWIMGMCIAFSHKSRMKRNVNAIKDIFRRGGILFALGLTLNTVGVGPVMLSDLRIMGVLQRFAICYIAVAFAMTMFSFQYYSIKLPLIINDVLILWPQWIIYLVLIIVHYMLTFHLPVPGCPTGYIDVGGIQDNSSGIYANCTGGAALYIDRIILGESHLYKGTELFLPYQLSVYFDPENILGCLSAMFQVFLGVQAGCTLVHRKSPKHKLIHWIVWGVLCLITGLHLHLMSIPMNKNLWSLSFVLVTSGLAFILIAFCYLVIDCRKWWNGAPFIYPGMNSVIIYVGHELCYNLFPWNWRLESMNTHFILLLENIWGLTVWILIAFWLYKKRFFLSI